MNDQNQQLNINKTMFDQKPIGNNNKKFQIPQYAPDENPAMISQTVNPQPRPLGQRLKKNIVKIKRQALEELLNLMKTNPQSYDQFSSMTSELLGFNDPISQQRALKIVVMFLNNGFQLNIEPKQIIKVIIQKCMLIEREQIKSNSQEILYWYMDNKYQDLLLHELNDYLIHKNRKLVATSLVFLSNLLNNYGIKRLKNMEMFYKSLQILASPPKPIAKNQTVILFKQIFRWVGQNCMKQFKIHPEVKDQIVKFAKQYQKQPLLIKRGIKKDNYGISKPVVYNGQEQQQNQQPVDVLSSYHSHWVDQVLQIQKWKQKKQELDQFIKKTKVQNILPPRQTAHFITLIKRLLKDNNINLLYCGLQITQNLAKGLKHSFNHVAKNVLSQIFFKLKDNKPATVEMTHNTLKCLLYSVSLEQCMDIIKEGFNDKAPLMKKQVLKFLLGFTDKKDTKTMNLMRQLLDKIVNLNFDGSQQVRNQSFQLLCKLKITHGMKFFGDKLKKLDQKKLQSLQLTRAPQAAGQQMMDIQQIPTIVQKPVFRQKQLPIPQIKNANANNQKVIYKNEQTSSINSKTQHKNIKTFSNSCLQEVSSPNQTVRANAYYQILNKYSSKQLRQNMYLIKSNAVKQSSQNILKIIIQIAKKHSQNLPIQLQTTQFLLKHDWKKCKQLLQDFIQNNKFSSEAQQYIKQNHIQSTSNSLIKSQSIINTPAPQNIPTLGQSLKQFGLQLQNNLITRMSNPLDSIKKQAAQKLISLWQNIPKITNQTDLNPTNGWNQEYILRYFNVIKFRLLDSNSQIVSLYSKLIIQMMNKGITLKYKHMKNTILPIIFNLLTKMNSQIKNLFKQMVINSPVIMFSMMQSQICIQHNRQVIIDFLHQNSELFFKFAELKNFMAPFLAILCSSSLELRLKNILDGLFHQMVQICGQNILQKQVNKLSVTNIDIYNQYLAKYNIFINKPVYNQPNSIKNYQKKQDRLKLWQQMRWQEEVTSNHLLKFANILQSIGEPFSNLCNILYLTQQNITILNKFEQTHLAQYSDILFKYIYWRSIIDNQQSIQHILRFTSRLVLAVRFQIRQNDIVMLLKSLINILTRYHLIFNNLIYDILLQLFSIDQQLKASTFQYWVNVIRLDNNGIAPIDEILKILMNCYQEQITQNLVTLARIQHIHKNTQFLQFIQSKCDTQHLVASGFKNNSNKVIQKIPVTQKKTLLCELGGPQNIIQVNSNQSRFFIDIFQQTSSQLQMKIIELTNNIDTSVKVQTFAKMFYSIIIPFFRGQIPMINVFTYIKQLQKLLAEPYQTKKTYLKDLTKMLLYFLIDLDQNAPNAKNNSQQLLKLVNKCILTVIQNSQARHMLQILLLLQKKHIELNLNHKLIHLIAKCIGKTTKNLDFIKKAQQNVKYIIEEISNIFKKYDIKIDNTLTKTYRVILNQLLKSQSLHQITYNIFCTELQQNKMSQTILIIFNQLLYESTNKIDAEMPLKQQQIRQNTNIHIKNIGSHVISKIGMKNKLQTQEQV